MGNKGMSAGKLLKQANQLKRAGRLDEALAKPSGSYIAAEARLDAFDAECWANIHFQGKLE